MSTIRNTLLIIGAVLAALVLAAFLTNGIRREQSEPPITQEDSAEPTGEGEEQMEEKQTEETCWTISVGDSVLTVEFADTPAAEALRQLLKDGPKTISADNYGGFEKVCSLGQSLPANDRQVTTQAGDVMLYNGRQIVIFYGENSWAYTRLGTVTDCTAESLKTALSGPETEVTISLK